MKNKIYKVVDEINNININCFITLDDELAIEKIKNELKKNLYLFENTKNIQEKAQLNTYFNIAKNYKLLNENNKKIFDYSELIKIKDEKK